MKILIADDHAVVREGLIRILAAEWVQSTFGEACNAVETLQQLRHHVWDLVTVDLTMPGRNGLELLQDLRIVRPQMPVLVLTMHPEEQYAVRAFKAGAAGYLTKESAREELVLAVRKVLSGGRYVSATLAERLARGLSTDASTPLHEILSDREFQVLFGIASGKTVSEIAREMTLSVKSVSSYRSRLLEKLGMHTNSELTRYAITSGLV